MKAFNVTAREWLNSVIRQRLFLIVSGRSRITGVQAEKIRFTAEKLRNSLLLARSDKAVAKLLFDNKADIMELIPKTQRFQYSKGYQQFRELIGEAYSITHS